MSWGAGCLTSLGCSWCNCLSLFSCGSSSYMMQMPKTQARLKLASIIATNPISARFMLAFTSVQRSTTLSSSSTVTPPSSTCTFTGALLRHDWVYRNHYFVYPHRLMRRHIAFAKIYKMLRPTKRRQLQLKPGSVLWWRSQCICVPQTWCCISDGSNKYDW